MGRPRTFEPDDALGRIKDAFWRSGYDGTSLEEIEAATGLRKQSLYRLFGDKKGMYLAALEHYGSHEIAAAVALLSAGGSAAERFAGLLSAVVADAAAGRERLGCFLAFATVERAQRDADTARAVERLVATLRAAFEDALAASPPFDKDASLRSRTAARLLAGFFGLKVLLKANADAETLGEAVAGMLETIAAARPAGA